VSDILITGDGKFPMDIQVPIVSAQTTADGRSVIVAKESIVTARWASNFQSEGK